MKCSTKKPGSKSPFEHPRGVVRQRPRPGRAARDDGQDRLEIEAGLVGVQERLADADDPARDQRLVDHLRVLPQARPALVDDRLADDLEQRPDVLERIGVPTDHDRKGGVAGSDVASRDGRVDRADAERARRDVDLPGEGGLARRHVDENRLLASSRQHPARAEHDLADVGGEPDHREDDRRAGRDLGRRVGPVGAAGEEVLRPRAGSRMDGDPVTRVEQVPAHRRPHHAGADPAEPLLERSSHTHPSRSNQRTSSQVSDPGCRAVVDRRTLHRARIESRIR